MRAGDFLAELGRTCADVMERVERLEDSANAIRDGITVNPGAAEVVERANDNTHTDARTLGEQVSVM